MLSPHKSIHGHPYTYAEQNAGTHWCTHGFICPPPFMYTSREKQANCQQPAFSSGQSETRLATCNSAHMLCCLFTHTYTLGEQRMTWQYKEQYLVLFLQMLRTYLIITKLRKTKCFHFKQGEKTHPDSKMLPSFWTDQLCWVHSCYPACWDLIVSGLPGRFSLPEHWEYFTTKFKNRHNFSGLWGAERD